MYYIQCRPIPKRQRHCSHSRSGNAALAAQQQQQLLQLSSRSSSSAITAQTALQPCSLAAMQPCSLAAMQPCSHAAMQPCSLAAMQPCSHAAMQPCSLAAMQPCSHAAMQPCSLAALQPNSPAPIYSLAAPGKLVVLQSQKRENPEISNSLTAQPPSKSRSFAATTPGSCNRHYKGIGITSLQCCIWYSRDSL